MIIDHLISVDRIKSYQFLLWGSSVVLPSRCTATQQNVVCAQTLFLILYQNLLVVAVIVQYGGMPKCGTPMGNLAGWSRHDQSGLINISQKGINTLRSIAPFSIYKRLTFCSTNSNQFIQFNISGSLSKLSPTMISFSIFVTLAAIIFTHAVHGQSCQSFGVDIGNGGTYYIDPASTAQFSFQSVFDHCTTSEAPILQLPDGNTITCSTISEATAGAIVTSTWYLIRSALMLIQ